MDDDIQVAPHGEARKQEVQEERRLLEQFGIDQPAAQAWTTSRMVSSPCRNF